MSMSERSFESFFLGQGAPGTSLENCYNGFVARLEDLFNSAPEQYKRIAGSRCNESLISFADFQEIAFFICKELSAENLSLPRISERLVQQNLVTANEGLRQNIQQMIFCTVGWLSMLFTPSKNFAAGKLSIEVHEGSMNSRRFDTWARSEQDLSEIHGSLADILRDFGNDQRGPLCCLGNEQNLPEIDMLIASNLTSYCLVKVGGIRIQWTDSICMHLELRRRDKTLMLFKHPSLCVMMCQTGKERIYLDQLFEEYFSAPTERLAGHVGPSPATAFYREVLVTYRLLFGQHKKSWKIGRSLEGVAAGRRWFRPAKKATNMDAFLWRLCCSDCTEEQLYDEIGAPEVRSVYSAQQDFPFLGDRLITLQEYMKLVEPTDWKALYYDRRDFTKFLTVWTAIVFGIITFILSLLGVALAAGQIATAFRPGQ